MTKIIACIDDSKMAQSVCDTAIWAAVRLQKQIMLLNTIEKDQQAGSDDLTGAIGLGARSSLLGKLTAVDEQRAKAAIAKSDKILAAALARATAAGVDNVVTKQRHGDFIEALSALEQEARLIVIGRAGQDHQSELSAIGSHIERIVRQVDNSIVIAPEHFQAPTDFMLAYDGRQVADEALQRIIDGGLLQGIRCHLVTIKNNAKDQEAKFEQAKSRLVQAGFEVVARYLDGEIYPQLIQYQQNNAIDLIVMGAFAHSKVRQFFLGSNTMRMIENCQTPLIVLK
ncbi:Nucleotide-binding universal stress protein, UspA family [Colwellia chukchiensis]|uniref:Nucleotide-binding universal stress protein, UspA family n=1 Tax=Colwellia chukchiensis TaxID=641665 RepID=A0A1H7T572_9GAMM|nr:universal stress protein [Colwellia chukchiensis]SEL78917.1 Nucleotide-binding universal stress protein, UspA family [Colwellia chukchiensis]